MSAPQIAEMKGVSRKMIYNSLARSKVQMRSRSVPRPESEWIICECGSRAVYTRGLCRPCYDRERNVIPEIQDRKLTWKLKKYFNISREEYNRLLQSQGGVCAICKKPPGSVRLCVDHDHACCPRDDGSCGKCIRGLLCRKCNRTLGFLEDSVEIAESLISYLKKFQENHVEATSTASSMSLTM